MLLLWCASTFVTPLAAVAAAPVPSGKPVHYPAWWFEREVIKRANPDQGAPLWPRDYPIADDFAALNQGQLKTLAVAAFDEFESRLPGGAGVDLKLLVSRWLQTNPQTGSFIVDVQGRRLPRVTDTTNDFAAANLGQLKAVAKVFIDRLRNLRFPVSYPWSGSTFQRDDFALANIGQAKNLFVFNLDGDTDGDGLSDLREVREGTKANDEDSDGDGISDYEEINTYGTDPNKKDSDGDGLTDQEEIDLGTNPNSNNTDGDGVDDKQDAFPDDERRTEAFPVVHYVSIDVSTPVFGEDEVIDVKINDNNEIGILASRPAGSGENATTEYRWTTWKKGQAGTVNSFLRDVHTSSVGTRKTKVYSASSVSATGTVAGGATEEVENFDDKGDADPENDRWKVVSFDQFGFVTTTGAVFTRNGKSNGSGPTSAYITSDGAIHGKGDEVSLAPGSDSYTNPPTAGETRLIQKGSTFIRRTGETNGVFPTEHIRYTIDPDFPDGVIEAERWNDPQEFSFSISNSGLGAGIRGPRDSDSEEHQMVMWDGTTFAPIFPSVEEELPSTDKVWAISDTRMAIGYSGQLQDLVEDADPESLRLFYHRDGPAMDFFNVWPETHRMDTRFTVVGASALVNGQDDILVRNVTALEGDTKVRSEWKEGKDLLFHGTGSAKIVEVHLPSAPVQMNGNQLMVGFTQKPRHDPITKQPLLDPVTQEPVYSKRAVLLVPLDLVKVDRDGNPTEELADLNASAPSPIVNITAAHAQNIRLDTDGVLRGDFTLSGYVTSDVCDTVPGDDGKIDEVQLYVNDADEPHVSIPMQVQKAAGTVFGKPFPYRGTFTKEVENVPLTEGNNILRISAFDKVYKIAGYSEWVARIIASPETGPGTGLTVASTSASLGLVTPSVPPTTPRSLTVAYGGSHGTATTVTLTETEAGSGSFHGVQGDVAIEMHAGDSLRAQRRNSLTAIVSDVTRGLEGYEISLVESAPGTGAYSGSLNYVANADGTAAAPPGAEVPLPKFYCQGVSFSGQSTGGEFYPVALRVRAPISLAEHLKVTLGTIVDGGFVAGPNPEACYLKRPGTSAPLIFGVRPDIAAPDPCDEEELTSRLQTKTRLLTDAAQFQAGFGAGLLSGGYHLVADTVTLVAGTAKYVARGVVIFGCGLTIAFKGAVGLDYSDQQDLALAYAAEQEKVHQGLKDVLWPIAQLLFKLQQEQHKQHMVVIGLLTGELEFAQTALESSEKTRRILQDGAEIFTQLLLDYSNKPPYEQGKLMGRAAFEIGSLFVAPQAVAGKLTKVQFLKDLKLTKFFKEGAGAATLAKLDPLVAVMETSKMCFVAGTKVWTRDGLTNIEQVRVGDWVLSRDEHTHEQAYKPVLQTFVTHPAALVHVRFAAHHRHNVSDSDDEGTDDAHLQGTKYSVAPQDNELVCTAEHPFFVSNRPEPSFVEAGDLRVGDVLALAVGENVMVTETGWQQAPAGSSFTTYNFEVEDFHTYFVGDAGVWVHNSGRTACEKAFSIMHRFYEREGDAWRAYESAMKRFPATMTEELRLKVFNEARRKWLNGEWTGGTPPWLNRGGQQTGVGGSSAILGRNLEVVGIVRPGPGTVAAHHIVAHGDARADAARLLLRNEKIDIDEAANGLFLPRSSANAANMPDLGPPHSRIHTDNYYNALTLRLQAATPGTLRNELQKIAAELVEGTFPW